MLVIINATKSITRSKGRNILIGIIILVIAISSCVALAIRNAANEAEIVGVDLINITGSISVDRQKMMESMQSSSNTAEGGTPDMNSMRNMMSNYQDLTLTELQTYAESDYIKDFYYSSSISLNASGELEAYSTESSSDTLSSNNNNGGNSPGGMGGQGGGRQGMGGMTIGDFTVTGYSAESAMTKFMDGTAKITDGEMFDITSADMKCLISNELALFNGLSVSDTITLLNPNTEDETYELIVSGIYTDSSSSETGNQMRFSTAMDPANLICISYNALKTIVDHSASVAITETNDNGFETTTATTGQLASTYVFSNRENYNNFSTELTAKGLPEYYTLLSSDISNYESTLVPLQNLSKFATTLLFIVIAIGAVILIVINIFNIRERKYEVGVLTAMGIKKGKVAMQFVTELLCVTLFAIIIGASLGSAVSVPISNSLLSSQIEQMSMQSNNQEQSFGRQGGMGGRQNMQPGGMMSMFGGAQKDVTYLDKINATVNLPIMGQLMGLGILLTLVSSLAAVIFVMRYEPLKILANRT